MKDASSQLLTATGRAKSDVANKLIGMFLHDLSARLCRESGLRVRGEKYAAMVRLHFANRCPYCSTNLEKATAIVEHLDGLNRYRAGLHVPGNVLVACKRCNSEKRRDDSRKILVLANAGWKSFLSHNGRSCSIPCAICTYWMEVWPDEGERVSSLEHNMNHIQSFRDQFPSPVYENLPAALERLYSDCQLFAKTEIEVLMEQVLSLHQSGR